MIRITKMNGKYYGIELSDSNKEAMKEIKQFVFEGTPVIIVDNINELDVLDIYDEVIMVDKDEDDNDD